jgi:hypothetical protein
MDLKKEYLKEILKKNNLKELKEILQEEDYLLVLEDFLKDWVKGSWKFTKDSKIKVYGDVNITEDFENMARNAVGKAKKRCLSHLSKRSISKGWGR